MDTRSPEQRRRIMQSVGTANTFLGLTTYSLQSHLRTSVKDVGQIEIDEL